jgi:hypothetical protein
MKVILSNQCLSLTGMLERGLGYHLVHRKNGFFARRDSKGFVPPDGHWRFIVLCAELAQNRLYITDIRVSRDEVKNALTEAHHFIASQNLRLSVYTARDIINLKTTFGL